MTGDWDEYVEALRTLGRAPAARDERSRRIDEQETTARRRADEALEQVDAAASGLETRLAEVTRLADRVLTESGAAEGDTAEVTLPAVTSIEAASAVVDRVERQLIADAAALAESRTLQQAARARRRRLVAIAVIAVVAIVLGAVLSMVV